MLIVALLRLQAPDRRYVQKIVRIAAVRAGLLPQLNPQRVRPGDLPVDELPHGVARRPRLPVHRVRRVHRSGAAPRLSDDAQGQCRPRVRLAPAGEDRMRIRVRPG